MGAGGIGSYLGGMLARSGVDVTLVCRGAHLAAINRSGLTVKSPGTAFTVEVKAVPAPVPADVTLVGVKLYDLASAARALPAEGLVITLQNGVTAAEEVGAVVGSGRVAAAAVFLNARLTAPGEVTSRSEINTVVFDEKARPLIDLCVTAGVDARAARDIRAELWRKFVPVAALSALSSLSRQPIGPVRDDPQLRRLYRQAMQEVADLAGAKGIALEADIVERTLALAERYKYDARVSMLEDLEAGWPLEVEWLSGYVSREAARLGVPAPFHDLAYACLKFVNDKTAQRPR